MISRRRWLAGAAAGWGAVGLHADPLGLPIGCQTYPVRESIGKDFEGTLRQLASIGYRRIEMCSPPGYARAGFGSLVDLKAGELRDRIQAAGLGCESCHYQFRELKENLDERISYARELGLKQMVLSTFGIRPDAGIDDWLRAAADLNRIAGRIHAAGMEAGYHNHEGEFRQLDGDLIYNKLMQAFDPKLVKMQFQVSVISLGFEAATFLSKYPGRFLSLHLQDWNAAEKKTAAIGQGVVDWKKTFAAAKTGGIGNYFVEMNLDLMAASYPYLHALKV